MVRFRISLVKFNIIWGSVLRRAQVLIPLTLRPANHHSSDQGMPDAGRLREPVHRGFDGILENSCPTSVRRPELYLSTPGAKGKVDSPILHPESSDRWDRQSHSSTWMIRPNTDNHPPSHNTVHSSVARASAQWKAQHDRSLKRRRNRHNVRLRLYICRTCR